MKKLLLFISVFTLILSITIFSASAETKALLPTDVSKWKSVEVNGENATAVIKDGATVVSGSVQAWPNVSYSMGEAEHIKVPIKGYAIEYDIVVDKGASNIFLYFKGETPEVNSGDKTFLFMHCIDTDKKDAGSGDVLAGTYKGVITLEDMMKNAKFPANCANDDNTITFSGISIYSVSGATVTVNKFQLIQATESTTSTSSTASTSSATSVGTSSAASSAASSSASKASSVSAASSVKSNSSGSSLAASFSVSSAPVESTTDYTWYYITGGVVAVCIVIIVVVIIKKNRK
jgi:hypothetical protein